jgi:quercetin 2,3-dioxygenase
MITVRRSEDRLHVRSRARESWMTFDPSKSVDPFRLGFHALESFNEERLSPDMALPSPSQENVDVLTYVQEGTLIREEASGRLGQLEAGEFQRTSARRDLRHPAAGGASIATTRVFQTCIRAEAVDPGPAQERRRFPRADREGVFRLVGSPDGRESSLRIRQDVRLYSSILLPGHHLIHELAEGRVAWLQVLQGRVRLRDHELGTGDGAALDGEAAVALTARGTSEILLFDLA